MTRRRLPALLLAASALMLTACAAPVGADPGPASDAPPGYSLGSLTPAPPDGEVIAQGMVMDRGGTAVLCLGAVAESYPPQCEGIPIPNWTWDGVDGSDTSGDARWGSYAVQGTYDGTHFTVTQPPIVLALYDPMRPAEPTFAAPGTTDEATLISIQDQLPQRLGAAYLSSAPRDGRLWVQVLWDDGTWQRAADDDYGKDVLVFESALRPVG